MRHGATTDGRASYDVACGVVEAAEPAQQQVTQAVRQLVAGPGPGQLGREQRVPAGPAVHPVRQLVGLRARDAADQLRGLRPGQPGQLGAADAGHPLQVGQEGPQRVSAVEVVGSVRHHNQYPGTAHRPGQEPDQVAGGAVRPVQVVDDPHQRMLGTEPVQQRAVQVEELRLVDRVVGRYAVLRQQPQQRGDAGLVPGQRVQPDHADQLAQRRAHRRQRQALGTELDARGPQHPDPGLGQPVGEVVEQPGLADAGVAAEQHQPRYAGLRRAHRLVQQRQLLPPPHEPLGRHLSHSTARRGRI